MARSRCGCSTYIRSSRGSALVGLGTRRSSPPRRRSPDPAAKGGVMFLLQVMFGVLGVLVRLPRRLLLGLVLFVLGLALIELGHPSPRSVPQHAPAAPGHPAENPAASG